MRNRAFAIPHLQMKSQNERCDRDGWSSPEERIAAGTVEGCLRILSQNRTIHPKTFWLREHLDALDEARAKARR